MAKNKTFQHKITCNEYILVEEEGDGGKGDSTAAAAINQVCLVAQF